MPTPADDPLIAAALRGFAGDAESTAAAENLLETLRTPQPAQEAAAIARWDSHDAKTLRFSWWGIFYRAAALIAALILIAGAYEFFKYGSSCAR